MDITRMVAALRTEQDVIADNPSTRKAPNRARQAPPRGRSPRWLAEIKAESHKQPRGNVQHRAQKSKVRSFSPDRTSAAVTPSHADNVFSAKKRLWPSALKIKNPELVLPM